MKSPLLYLASVTILVLAEGLFLRNFGPAAPSLLAVVIVISMYRPFKIGLAMALWSGLLLDVLSTLPFGIYVFISLGMFVLAKMVYARGLILPRYINVFLLTTGLLAWQYGWLWILALSQGAGNEGLPLLGFYLAWKSLLAAAIGLWTLRLLHVQ